MAYPCATHYSLYVPSILTESEIVENGVTFRVLSEEDLNHVRAEFARMSNVTACLETLGGDWNGHPQVYPIADARIEELGGWGHCLNS